jgi:hypothetical protein
MSSSNLKQNLELFRLKQDLMASGFSELDPIETFKNKLFIHIPPMKKEIQPTPKLILTNSKNDPASIFEKLSILEQPIKLKLRKIFNQYNKKFEEICREVIHMKYSKIFMEIYHFLMYVQHVKDPILRTIVINTDQNVNDFFTSMEEFFNSRIFYDSNKSINNIQDISISSSESKINGEIIFVPESKFQNLKSLFEYLEISDHETNDFFHTEEEFYSIKQKIKLIILRDIQKIDKFSLNILIARLIDYHNSPNRLNTNILVFDVSYDQRGLYEKIKPNHLCKMTFSNVENIPSKNIYQEVLYKFIYENPNSLFVPNSKNLKKIVDCVKEHQISVKSFKHYFKFILIDFFLVGAWSNDKFLIYSTTIPQDATEEDLYKYFNKRLNSMYKPNKPYDKNDIYYLVNYYLKEKNNRDLFISFYNFLEDLNIRIKTLAGKQVYDVDKFEFFFDFLQLGWSEEEVCENRTQILRSILDNINREKYDEIVQEEILGSLKKFMEINNIFEKIEKNIKLEQILSAKATKEIQSDMKNLEIFLQKFENLVENPSAGSYENHFGTKSGRIGNTSILLI